MEIADIPVARICDQFHEYLALMEELDLDVAGEYVYEAALLIQLKSRMLLPRPAEAQGEPDAGPAPGAGASGCSSTGASRRSRTPWPRPTACPNLVATLPGSGGGRSMMLLGHADVVSPGEGWTVDPFAAKRKDGAVYGRGAADMKGGMAAAVAALEILAAEKIRLRGDVILASVVDEEAAAWAPWHWSTAVTAPTARSSRADRTQRRSPLPRHRLGQGDHPRTFRPHRDAAAALARGRRCRCHRPGARYSSTPSTISMRAGPPPEQAAPATATPVSGDGLDALEPVSTPPPTPVGCTSPSMPSTSRPNETARTRRPGESRVGATFSPASPGNTMNGCSEHPPRIEWLVDADCAETPGDHELTRTMHAAAESVGAVSRVEGMSSHTDMGLLVNAGIPTVNFGPGAPSVAHQPDEHVSERDLLQATMALALATAEWCGWDQAQ